MALRLEIVSRQRRSLGERGVKQFGRDGGTIGRSLDSDWVLPDALRFLSARHACIDYRSGSYYIIDTSTNGVFVNGSDQAVGRGKPQRLFSGDRLKIGDYEIVVAIDEVESSREQPASRRHIDPVDLKQRVEAPEETSYDLVDALEITGIGLESILSEDTADTLVPLTYKFKTEGLSLEDDEPAPRKPVAKPRPTAKAVPPPRAGARRDARVPARARVSHAAPGASPPPNSAPAAPAQPTAASLEAFFRGAGISAPRLDPEQTEKILRRLGRLMRELIVGLTENLQTRAAQKNALRQPDTTIQPRDNNALKFSAGVEASFESLLFGQSEQFLGGADAVHEAFADIKRHQQVLFKAMQRTVVDYIDRLDPDLLEEKFATGRHNVLRGAANKLKYWDLYKALYQVVAQRSPGELPQLFLDDLAQVYEAEAARAASPLERLKAKAG